jgi:hypothetical protein
MITALAAEGHVVVRDFIDRRLADTLYNVLRVRRFRGEFKRDDQVPHAFSFWGDSTLDAFLLAVLPDVERIAGCSLLPTYCYARLYLHGDALARHSDRAACEVAATIHLGSSGGEPPPICFAPDHAVPQQPGDAVVYLGTEVDHWRDTYEGTDFGQIFVNYVRADGPHRDLAFDGRTGMFPPSILSQEAVSAARVRA